MDWVTRVPRWQKGTERATPRYSLDMLLLQHGWGSTNVARAHNFRTDPPRCFDTICPPSMDGDLCKDTVARQLSLLVDRSLALSCNIVSNSNPNFVTTMKVGATPLPAEKGSIMLDCSVLAFVDTYPTVCSYLFRQISLSRDHSRFFSLALSLFVEEVFWPRYARIQQITGGQGG
jgi:hypothetical protein